MGSNIESSFVNLEGIPVKFFYDSVSMMDVEQILDNMKGPNHRDFVGMTVPPYDTRDLVIMIMFGINGAKRAVKDNNLITFGNASEMYQRHVEHIGKTCNTNEEIIAAYNTLKNEISVAAKKSMNLFIDSPTV